MGIVFAGIAPHPPLLIPEVGGRELKKVDRTVQAMEDFSRRAAASGAERLVVITPHGPVFRDAVAVFGDDVLEGDFARFGAPQIKISLKTDRELLNYLGEEAESARVPLNVMGTRDGVPGAGVPDLDHGAAVPLYYLSGAGMNLQGLHITFGLMEPRALFAWGQALQRAVNRIKGNTAVIASGDLSHRLTRSAPAGYNPAGAEFDRMLVDLVRQYDVPGIMNLDPALVDKAGECGLRSVIIALGAMEGMEVSPEILSYEGPFGVGYLVADFNIKPGG